MKKTFIFYVFSFCTLSEMQASNDINFLDLRNKIGNLLDQTNNYSTSLTVNNYLRFGTCMMAGIGIGRLISKDIYMIFGGMFGSFFAMGFKVFETDLEKERDKLASIYQTTQLPEHKVLANSNIYNTDLNSENSFKKEESLQKYNKLLTAYCSFTDILYKKSNNKKLYNGKETVFTETLNKLKDSKNNFLVSQTNNPKATTNTFARNKSSLSQDITSFAIATAVTGIIFKPSILANIFFHQRNWPEPEQQACIIVRKIPF